MNEEALSTLEFDLTPDSSPTDPAANPFRLVLDPVMRIKLRRALFDMIEHHDQELARYVSEGSLALDSYKEYIEIFARTLRETMASQEGVAWLLESCGFQIKPEQVNLQPEMRWKVTR